MFRRTFVLPRQGSNHHTINSVKCLLYFRKMGTKTAKKQKEKHVQDSPFPTAPPGVSVRESSRSSALANGRFSLESVNITNLANWVGGGGWYNSINFYRLPPFVRSFAMRWETCWHPCCCSAITAVPSWLLCPEFSTVEPCVRPSVGVCLRDLCSRRVTFCTPDISIVCVCVNERSVN